MLQNLGFSNADKEKVPTLLPFFLLPIYLINSHKTLLRASVLHPWNIPPKTLHTSFCKEGCLLK